MLSLPHLERYLNPSFSSDPTLYVLANHQKLYYFWVNDVFDYCLRWQPLDQRQSTTWYVTNINLSDRILQDQHGHELVRSSEPEFENALPLWMLVARNVDDWKLGTWCRPKTMESLSTTGLSAYITYAQSPGGLARFDVSGYWSFLQEEARERPWVFFALGSFLGLLTPTSEMSAWARRTIESFSSQFNIPVAYRILAAEASQDAMAFGKAAVRDRLPNYRWWRDYDSIDDRFHDWQRFTSEYFGALAHFLMRCIEHGDGDAQDLLFTLFGEQDPSIQVENLFGLRLQLLAEERRLLPGESLDTLLRWINLDYSAEPEAIVRGIAEFLSRDAHDARFNK